MMTDTVKRLLQSKSIPVDHYHRRFAVEVFYRSLAVVVLIIRGRRRFVSITGEDKFRLELDSRLEKITRDLMRVIPMGKVRHELERALANGSSFPPVTEPILNTIYRLAWTFVADNSDSFKAYIHPLHDAPLHRSFFFEDRHEWVRTASGAPVVDMTQGLLRFEDWHPDGDGTLTLKVLHRKAGMIQFIIDKADVGNLQEFFIHEAHTQLSDLFDAETARIHQLLGTCVMHTKRPWEETVTVAASEIIREIGLCDRQDLTVADKLRYVAERLDVLRKIDVLINWKQKGMNLNVTISRVWDIELTARYRPDPFSFHAAPVIEDIEVSIRAGLWAEKFLNEEGKAEKTALFQFRSYPRSLMNLAPKRNELALRMGMYVAGLPDRGEGFRVGTILKAIFSEQEMKRVLASRTDTKRFKERWDAALLDLKDQGWTITFPTDQYPRELLPVWELPEGESPERLPRNYVLKFLKAKVIITSGRPLTAKPKTRARSITDSTLFGQQVREAREGKGMSLRDAADLIGISKSLLAAIEKGARSGKKITLSKIKRFLGLV